MTSTANMVRMLKEMGFYEKASRLESLNEQCVQLLRAVVEEETSHEQTRELLETTTNERDQLREENTELKCERDKLKCELRMLKYETQMTPTVTQEELAFDRMLSERAW